MIDLDDFDLNFPDSEVDVDDICALVTSTQRSKLSFNKMGPKTLHSPFILDTWANAGLTPFRYIVLNTYSPGA